MSKCCVNFNMKMNTKKVYAVVERICQRAKLCDKTTTDVLVPRAFSRLLYDAEIRTVKETDSREVLAFEMRCCKRIQKCVARTESARTLLEKK